MSLVRKLVGSNLQIGIPTLVRKSDSDNGSKISWFEKGKFEIPIPTLVRNVNSDNGSNFPWFEFPPV